MDICVRDAVQGSQKSIWHLPNPLSHEKGGAVRWVCRLSLLQSHWRLHIAIQPQAAEMPFRPRDSPPIPGGFPPGSNSLGRRQLACGPGNALPISIGSPFGIPGILNLVLDFRS